MLHAKCIYGLTISLVYFAIVETKSLSLPSAEIKCQLECLNGGKCINFEQTNGQVFFKCVCSKYYYGEKCNSTLNLKRVKRTPIKCDYVCYNGGTCNIRKLDDTFHFVCLCSEGFSGEQCRDPHIIDEGESPQFKTINSDDLVEKENTEKKTDSYQHKYFVLILMPFAVIVVLGIVGRKIYNFFVRRYPETAQQARTFIERQTSVKDKK